MTVPARSTELTADADAAGERLDRWLAGQIENLSRSRLKALIEQGQLQVDGTVLTDPSAKVAAGSVYALDIPAPRAAEPTPEKMDLDVLFEDDDLIVLVKPAGLAVHPAAGNWTGTLVHGLLHHCAGSLSGIGGVERPGIVHRLDKDTSGVMVVAKSDAAHQGLATQFAAHSVERAYIAFTRNAPSPKAGRIETRIVRSPNDRKKFVVPRDPASEAGKHAITNYTTLARYGQAPARPSAPGWRPRWNAGSRRGGPTRSASTWPISAARCWAIRSTATGVATCWPFRTMAGNSRTSGGRPCTRRFSDSSTR